MLEIEKAALEVLLEVRTPGADVKSSARRTSRLPSTDLEPIRLVVRRYQRRVFHVTRLWTEWEESWRNTG